MLTRRVVQRMFLLRPDEGTNAIFGYCLAEAAERHGVELIAWTAMSNHYHAIVHDPGGTLPAFLEHFHKMLAKTLNAKHERWENLWSTEETCVTRLVTQKDIDDKVVYVLANPVAAHLVDRVADWPGASSWGLMGRPPKAVKRPPVFFRRRRSAMRPAAELVAVAPPNLKGESYQQWVARIRRAVALEEDVLRAKRLRSRTKLVGRKAVLSTHPFSGPNKEARHRKLRPALACRDKERMKKERAILKGFRVAYAKARRAYVTAKGNGRSAVVFPAGTYLLRCWGVRCEPLRTAA